MARRDDDMQVRQQVHPQSAEWQALVLRAEAIVRDRDLAPGRGSIGIVLREALSRHGAGVSDAAILDILVEKQETLRERLALRRLRRVAAGLSTEFGVSLVPAAHASPVEWILEGDLESGTESPLPSCSLKFALRIGPVPDADDAVASFPDADGEQAAGAALRKVLSPEIGRVRRLERIFAEWREQIVAQLGTEGGVPREEALRLVAGQLRRLRQPLGRVRPLHADVVQALESVRTRLLAEYVAARHAEKIRRDSGFDDYVRVFPVARGLRRRHLVIAGPTNSGKTYAALREAAKGASAVVLSPLRLLALEHHEALCELGLEAAMRTGEERIEPEGYTHLAQTIETLDLERRVDVAVIDEAQMLVDPDRGWAWTQALVGAPADLVVSTGSTDVIPLVTRIAALCGEPVEIVTLERKTPLIVEQNSLSIADVRRGDALIAFSRRGVLAWRDDLIARGFSVSAVYGALSPEVRRSEARRFRNGEADVLVATDAIGMGLNFGPLRRILFTALEKFDGIGQRPLTQSEILQIAGRAGRYGHHEAGFVGVMAPRQSGAVARAVGRPLPPLSLPQYFVRPDRRAITATADVLGTQSLAEILLHLRTHLTAGSENFMMADLSEVVARAKMLDSIPLPIGVRYAYTLCPIDNSDENLTLLRSWARWHHAGKSVPPPTEVVSGPQAGLEADSRRLTGYLWMALRFPHVFQAVEDALETRREIDGRIMSMMRSAGSGRRSRRPAETDPLAMT